MKAREEYSTGEAVITVLLQSDRISSTLSVQIIAEAVPPLQRSDDDNDLGERDQW